MSDRVQVVAPDGTIGDVPADQVPSATEEGFRVLTPEVQAELERGAKYGGVGGIAKSALAGAARGLTLGLSDPLLVHSGAVKAQTLKDLKEENPTASTVGEVVGSVAPVIGQLGLGAKAAKAAGAEALGTAADAALKVSPAGIASALGEGIESAIVGDVARKSMAAQIAAKLTGGMVRGAAEAELYNIGNNISEATLGDEKLTAERLLAHSEDAMLIGGGLGFGVTAGGLAVRAAAEKASGALSGLSDWLKKHAPFADPQKLNAFAESTAAKVGMEADDVKAIFANVATPEGQQMRASLGPSAQFVSPEERNEIGIAFKKAFREARDGLDEAKDKAFSEFRPKEIAALVKDVDIAAASEAADNLGNAMQMKLAEMKQNPDVFAAKGLISKLDDIAKGYEKRLGAVESPEELFNLIDDTKKTIDKQAKMWGRDIRPEIRDTVNAVKDIRSQFATHLTDEGLWGQAAARQAAFNEKANRLFTAERNLIGRDGKVGAFGVKVNKRDGSIGIELSDKKVNTFLSQTGATRSEAQTNALREWFEAAQDFAREVEASSTHVPEAVFDRAGIDSLIEKSRGIAADAEKKLALESKVRQAARLDDIGMNMFPKTAGAAMGAVLGGLPGAGIGAGAAQAGVQLLTMRNNPIAMAKTLARVEGFALGPAKAMGKAIDDMIKKAAPASGALKRGIGEATKQIIDSDKDDYEEFKKTQKRLAQNVASGEARAAELQEGWSKLGEHAPKTQAALISKQLEIDRFLLSKAPTNPFVNTATNPAATFWRPPDSQLSAFKRYQRAATNPLSVVQDAAKGVVTKESVETFKTLYPGLYEDFKLQLFDKVATKGAQIPYHASIALSALFEVPLVAVMRPDIRAALQKNYADDKDEKADEREKLPNVPTGELKTANNMRSDEQARALRR